jgi:hypothetical protein
MKCIWKDLSYDGKHHILSKVLVYKDLIKV